MVVGVRMGHLKEEKKGGRRVNKEEEGLIRRKKG
jgi:hypothetical protein